MMNIQEIETVLKVFDDLVKIDNPEELRESLLYFREKLNGERPSLVIKQLFVLTGEQIETLQQEKNELLKKKPVVHHQPKDGFYDFKNFLEAVQSKRNTTYGWRIDCITASNSPDCKPIRNEDIQKWMKSQLVPDWAYEQISRMNFPKRATKIQKLAAKRNRKAE